MVDRLVVVGGGAAGMSAASAARRVDPELEVVVLEATGHAAWGVCGIPYYVAGVVPTASDLVAYPPRFFRRERGLDLRLHACAVALDPGRHELTYEHDRRRHRLRYDVLVVAAGAAPAVPPLPGADDDRVFTIRTLEDCRLLRSRLDAGHIARALVVGAGYVGLEMVEALAERGCHVLVSEILDRVMPTLDPEMAAPVEAEVRDHADLRLRTSLEEIVAGPDGLTARLGDGSGEPVDTVIIATGVRPSGGIAAGAGAATTDEGALLVDERMRTSLPDVHAAGDCVAVTHRVLERPAYVPLAPAANKTGRVAGTVAAGGEAWFAGVVGTAVVKVFALTVARTGLTLAQARDAGLEAVATDDVALSRAKYYPGAEPITTRLVHEPSGRLLGAQMVSRDPSVAKRIDAVATALHARFGISQLAELDLAYAPPYAPVWDPILRAAQAAMRATRPAGVGA